MIEWLVDNSAGNPLALVELPAALTGQQLAGHDPLAGVTAPPTTVEQVYLQRVASLPQATRSLLVLAAAEGTGARATVERAAVERGYDIAELTAAEAVGLIRVDAEQFVFRHPMMRSAIYRGALFADREAAHRSLAAAAAEEGNVDRAAWHRAAATVGTDDTVAAELEAAAIRSSGRSGYAAAATALERAAELSSDERSKARRLVAAASAAWAAGQPDRATAQLDRASTGLVDALLSSDIKGLRGVIAWRCGSLADACRTLIAGAQERASLDRASALSMLADAAIACWDAGDYGQLTVVGDKAEALGRFDDDDDAQLMADVLIGSVILSGGDDPVDRVGFDDAVRRASTRDDHRLTVWAAIGAELVGDVALERELLDRSAAIARSSGAVDKLIVTLESSAVQGFVAGNVSITAEATEGVKLALEAGLPNAASLFRGALAWVAAVQGREGECRELAARVIEVARPNGHGIANSIAEWALALLDLGLGRLDDTVERLTALHSAPPGVAHPFYVHASVSDLVEAAMRTGRRDVAQAAYERLARFERDGAAPAFFALSARCRALMATGAEAEQQYADALAHHAEQANPIDRARTELLYGEFLRREKRRSDARAHLRNALSEFELLRAEPWAERARTELRATGETARKRDPSTAEDLTPQELQIARLVAEGNSNKECAARLFLSPRTVEYHLRKVFAKLGIASRSDLIRDGVVTTGREASSA